MVGPLAVEGSLCSPPRLGPTAGHTGAFTMCLSDLAHVGKPHPKPSSCQYGKESWLVSVVPDKGLVAGFRDHSDSAGRFKGNKSKAFGGFLLLLSFFFFLLGVQGLTFGHSGEEMKLKGRCSPLMVLDGP